MSGAESSGWRHYHVISSCVAGSLGLVLSSFLLIVIVQIKNKELQKYNQIMLQNCVIDIVFSVFNFFGTPMTVAYFNFGITVLDSLIYFQQVYRVVFVNLWMFIFMYSISVLPISFYYRYRILCLKKSFPPKLHVYCLGAAFLNALLFVLHFYYAEIHRTQQFFVLTESRALLFLDGTGKVNPVAVIGFDDAYLYVFIFHSFLILVVSCAVISWCSSKMYKFLQAHKSTASKKYREMHEELTKTLIFQAVFPIATFLTPFVFLNLSTILPIEVHPQISASVNFFIAYIPVMNASTILLFVKSYRTEAKNFLKTTKSTINTTSIFFLNA